MLQEGGKPREPRALTLVSGRGRKARPALLRRERLRVLNIIEMGCLGLYERTIFRFAKQCQYARQVARGYHQGCAGRKHP
ncbi:hypothetical protein AGJ34_14695 [Cronobacter dublinensis subsp. dublinensis]|nr:hypothetical protein [Cronobacter dublinensis subsp. dublinensis]EGT5670478.1 hypothetical protein [Cronobacter dublinensis subsp. dublinensis]EGT5674240.1 hypothetical protein [Cronobacter dublinensis subsp. dublinensis]EGT5678395.1 hypothetical protein [Cronobacter dublinensis subsp. dublinensis]EGT5686885.1 hypothetical protein [Cronobacter dublinensis subsp. dublinensis]